MMYLFPRQFGLHNVFTSAVDRRQTAQKLQDYTLREEEIAVKYPLAGSQKQPVKHVPKRLRGKTVELVQRLQVLHSRCSYAAMLQHYCPVSAFSSPALNRMLIYLGSGASRWSEHDPSDLRSGATAIF